MDVTPSLRSRLRGCLLGGAIGDAMGAVVEFHSLRRIRSVHGPAGVTDLPGDPALITDDTQMTLFTAEGLVLAGDGDVAAKVESVRQAYLRWYATQVPEVEVEPAGWLFSEPFLHSQRAPGNTCLSALRSGGMGAPGSRINDSKGCGGVMRAAPCGAFGEDAYGLGVLTAALTHTHPTGYLASGAFAEIIRVILGGGSVADGVDRALGRVEADPDGGETVAALRGAVAAAEDGEATAERVESLGAGWIAEEALAIGAYAALVADDFAHGVRLAVNHSGDSDSTGSIAGNLMGALGGEDALPEDWIARVEGAAVIAATADRLADL